MSDSFVDNIMKLSRYADKLNRRESSSLDILDWDASRYSGSAPKTDWLVEGFFPIAVPILFAGYGGIGKSYTLLALAAAVATYGEDTGFKTESFLCDKVASGGTAVYFSAEDSQTEIHRRLLEIDPERKIQEHPEKLRIIPLSDAGGAFAIIKKNNKGYLEVTAEFEDIMEKLKEIDDLAMIIFDPLQVFAQAEIDKDNNAAQFFCNQMRLLASETGATVIISHHMRKPDQQYPIKNLDQARESVRGASGLVDGVRGVMCLWEHKQVVYAGMAKFNFGAKKIAHELKRLDSGILASDGESADGNKKIVLNIITECAKNTPLTSSGKRSLFDRRTEFDEQLSNWPRKKCTNIITLLLENDEITKEDNGDLLPSPRSQITTESGDAAKPL